MIRPAQMQDIPDLLALLKEAHAKSRYRDICGIDEVNAKALLMQSIAASWEGACFAEVAEQNGKAEGFIIGHLSPVYLIGDKLMATDLFWLASRRVDPKDPRKLMQNMVAWARNNPDVIEVRCGATPVLQEPEKAGKMLTRIGFKPYGAFYQMELSQ